jgi:3-methylcrotonyl-CoA carboxylase alpha subunit
VKGLRCGDERFEPLVRETDGGFEVSVAGEIFRFALSEEAPGVFVFREGSRAVRFHLAREGTTVHLFWDGRVHELTEEREGVRPARRHDAGALEAPMPGRVAAVRAEPGQRVKKGEELLVVEAMKMENALRAPRNGVVRAVHVTVGDMVAPGRPLVEFEAAE